MAAIVLIQDWNGCRRGSILPDVPDSSSDLLIARGVAKLANENESTNTTNAELAGELTKDLESKVKVSNDDNIKVSSKSGTDDGTAKPYGSEKAPGDHSKRRRTRRGNKKVDSSGS